LRTVEGVATGDVDLVQKIALETFESTVPAIRKPPHGGPVDETKDERGSRRTVSRTACDCAAMGQP
jgi:hypothetical protein